MSRRNGRDRPITVGEQGGRYTLLAQAQVADGAWSRGVGLIGTRQLAAGEGLVIYPCSSVHTFFMRMPIDVVYVSRTGQVIDVDRRLKPWRIGKLHRGVRYVIETASGGADRVQPGDVLQIIGWAPGRKRWAQVQR